MIEYIHPDLRSLALPIDSLNEDPRNANAHNERSQATLSESFKRFGQRKPIVVRRTGMIVEAGNGTLAALRAAGWTHIACVLCDDDEQTATAYALIDNQAARLSRWDPDALRDRLDELTSQQYDVQALGWKADEIVTILAGKAEQLVASLESASADEKESRVEGVPVQQDASTAGDAMTFSVVVDFDNEVDQAALLEELENRHLHCRLMMF